MRSACVIAAAALASCTTASQPRFMAGTSGWGPMAELVGTDGRSIGIVQTRYGPRAWGLGLDSPWNRQPQGVLPPGTHALHIHEVGRCDPPDFASAGGHWNPTGKQHGHDNPAGWHLGDLGNYEVEPGGLISISTSSSDSRLVAAAPGNAPVVLDADGAAVILHAAADDEKTDPSGNSGARIACAVLPPPK